MAEAVLDDVTDWFEEHVFSALLDSKHPESSVWFMFEAVNRYFRSGKRICLVGAFALDDTRDQFEDRIGKYFNAWLDALTTALNHMGFSEKDAAEIAEDTVVSIQGVLVLARSKQDAEVFIRTLWRLQGRIATGPQGD